MIHLIEPSEIRLFKHLAAEDALLDGSGAGVPVLMIWRGPKAVVMGKNQNPWKECNLEVIRERGLLLGRRVSGGGTVYHDPGNVNFSWVVDRKAYRPEVLHGILRDALAQFGLAAETAATGGVLVEGHKVSGAAYCYRQERVLHHGTLLWRADLPMMRAALSAPRVRLKTHAVNSVPARVKNLSDWLPDHDAGDVVEALVSEAEKRFGARAASSLDGDAARERAARLQSPEWIWGQTPRFEAEVGLREERLQAVIHRGRVEKVRWRGEERIFAERPLFGPEGCKALAEHTGEEEEAMLRAFREGGWVWWA
ncbi:MAG: lipoate--protein ligase family protein [Verrucomicrobia bacterium]|nr:lipoate--protein ligase family protein [Verrucomicrobiota bacterium]MCH8526578.1 lipoate--protein ligase family protein [Kiritimatiellia bacterium]